MFELLTVYFALLAIRFASDIAAGIMDAAMKQPALKEAAELVGGWLNQFLREQALAGLRHFLATNPHRMGY